MNNSEDKVAAWKIWQDAPWGRLFYTVARNNLQRHLEARTLRILDVGGGNGLDAIYLAHQGHHVTLIDSSAEMLAAARDNAILQQVIGKLTFHQVDVDELSLLNLSPTFDVVLCHNLLQYVDDPKKLLVSLHAVIKDNGYLSIISGNRYSESLTLALQHLDFESATAQLDASSRNSGVFGKAMHLYTPDQIIQGLEMIGCTLVGQYGIRCLIDYIPNNDLKLDPTFFSRLEQLERAISDRYPYYLFARYFHLVARNSHGT